MRQTFAHLLSEFVNREDEMARFNNLLDDDVLSILIVWGEGGFGKSTLQARMMHEVAQRNLDKSEIVWTDSRNHDYLAIMRKIRDDVGTSHFEPFTYLVNYFTVPQYELKVKLDGATTIQVAQGATTTNSEIGDIAGIVIKDVMLTQPRDDMQISESERRARLTDCFIKCLEQATLQERLIVFLDAVEKMSEETEAWIWQELLAAARDGHLGRTKFILCGRKPPRLDRSWNMSAKVSELHALEREHIVAYLEKRGVEEEGREMLADMLIVSTRGNLLELATNVDGYLKFRERRQKE